MTEEIKTENVGQGQNMNWIDSEMKEAEEIQAKSGNYLKLEPGKMMTLMISPLEPIPTVESTFNGETKKMKNIPVTLPNGESKTWSLNPANPIYMEILESLKAGNTSFKILRTGEGPKTTYTLVKE